MRLADETGRSEVIYGYDEFGNDIRTAHDIFNSPMQSFGFTGYQMDEAGGLYFAQARRYDAGVNAVKGAAFSLPGGFMQWATGPSNTTAQSLMKGYNSNSTNVYGLFYGLIDNGLLAADSTGNLFGDSTASVENSVAEMEKNNVGKE